MKDLRIAGKLLQFNGWLTLLFGILLTAIYIYSQGAAFTIKAAAPAILFLSWCVALISIGGKIKSGARIYKIPGIIASLLSLITSPIGFIFGLASLFYQIRGKDSFLNS
ncbi:hypothetical protein [Microbulbifer sp. JMSA002]|uniref:hypothetical protein n=1 Tax=Microbulbifer sp. JMSA002 TaxID=3243368 RepID=UPI004039F051